MVRDSHTNCGTGSAYSSDDPEFTSVFSGVRVTWSLVLCVCFVDRYLSYCPFSFGHCVVFPSSIYGLWLPFGIFKLFLRDITLPSRKLMALYEILEIEIYIDIKNLLSWFVIRNLFLSIRNWYFCKIDK
jgi:hypothetical protein